MGEDRAWLATASTRRSEVWRCTAEKPQSDYCLNRFNCSVNCCLPVSSAIKVKKNHQEEQTKLTCPNYVKKKEAGKNTGNITDILITHPTMLLMLMMMGLMMLRVMMLRVVGMITGRMRIESLILNRNVLMLGMIVVTVFWMMRMMMKMAVVTSCFRLLWIFSVQLSCCPVLHGAVLGSSLRILQKHIL